MFKIIENKDNLIKISSSKIENFVSNELITVDGKRGFVFRAYEKEAIIIMIDDASNIKSKPKIIRSKKNYSFSIPSDPIGKVFDYNMKEISLFNSAGIKPIYNLKASTASLKDTLLDSINYSTNIDSRNDINEPLLTGKISIDAVLPIGKGQRQLIIGDRRTGKTFIGLSAIMAQKDTGVICVYVSIGNKKSNLLQIYNKLKENKALNNTIIVYSESDGTSGSNYITPYIGMAIAEKFKDEGKDVLIVFDDLSRHARFYRAIALVSGLPAGREGYPGDIFFQHSKLLERAGNFNKKFGGGSITALPIVETQQEDISGYISTNIISITDGQIFTSASDFNAYKRPAVNVPFSVSRVGGKAQHKFIKNESSDLKNIISQSIQIVKRSVNKESITGENKKIVNNHEVFSKISSQSEDDIMSQEEQWVFLILLKNGILNFFKHEDIIKIKLIALNMMRTDRKLLKFMRFLEKQFSNNLSDDQLLKYYVNILFGSLLLSVFTFLYKEDIVHFRKHIQEFSHYDNHLFDLNILKDTNDLTDVKFDNLEKTLIIDLKLDVESNDQENDNLKSKQNKEKSK